jgi:hypothetical protein
VSEADVPKLHVGMEVYFTTLGGDNRRFHGKLRQIPPTPSVVNNVVLYDALFDVANPDRLLMTQMTAPKLGEKVLDPAAGTGGFLSAAIDYIREKRAVSEDVWFFPYLVALARLENWEEMNSFLRSWNLPTPPRRFGSSFWRMPPRKMATGSAPRACGPSWKSAASMSPPHLPSCWSKQRRSSGIPKNPSGSLGPWHATRTPPTKDFGWFSASYLLPRRLGT